jgi:hypothetical protein
LSRGAVILDAFARPTAVTRKDIRAHYEGAQGSVMRSVLPGIVQEARKDLRRATRRELLRVSRQLWKNNPLLKAVTERLVTYTIGTGILFESDSSDSAWNKAAADVWAEWCKRPDLTSKLPLAKLQEIAFRSMLIDGDIFIHKTYGSSGRPRVQLIESHQVGNPNQSAIGKNDDGIVADKNGRPVEYIVQEPTDEGITKERRVSADYFVPLANIERTGQGRGACVAAAALTTAIDLHDILGLEKGAVKDASGKTDIIKTASGEIDPDDVVRGSQITSDSTEVTRYYREVFGPEAKVLKHGDEFTPYEPKRPGPAWQGFVDFLAELVCLSYNMPPSTVRQIKVGGADTRRDLGTLQRVCEPWQMLCAHAWQDVYEYVIEAEIEDGALSGAPRDWRRTECQFTRAATVDAGRTSQQDREDVRSGNMTLREQCGQFGVPWRRHIRQLAVEARAVMDEEKANGLPEGFLLTRLYGGQNGTALQLVMPGQQTQPAKETNDE